MRKKALDTIGKFHMFPQKAKIIVGLSGGMDSVALLHILCGRKAENGWEITAVHINHGLRGTEADEDQRFAEALCRELGVACEVRKYDVKAEAEKRRLGEEETGRLLRYEVFRELAGENGRIAVAHHRKDQAETVLMRLCRGTGLTGLVGMRPVRDGICRPLLYCTREEIAQYCRENGLNWREDASNQEERYTRNKLRLQVLPLLEEIHTGAEEHIAQTAALLALEEDYLEHQTVLCYEAVKMEGAGIVLHREKVLELHPAMRRRVLRKAMAEFLSADVSQVQIEALEELLGKETGKSRDFSEGVRAENCYDALVLSAKQEKAEGCHHALPLGETIVLSEQGLTVTAWTGGKVTSLPDDTKCFDFDLVKGELSCRTRKTGDFISLKNGRKKIKDLFIDEKVPRKERETIPLIAVGEEILWAFGLRVSEKYQPDENTENYLYVRIEKA